MMCAPAFSTSSTMAWASMGVWPTEPMTTAPALTASGISFSYHWKRSESAHFSQFRMASLLILAMWWAGLMAAPRRIVLVTTAPTPA